MKLQNPFTAICSDADAAVLFVLGRAPVELTAQQVHRLVAVSYTHLTLPTTPYV